MGNDMLAGLSGHDSSSENGTADDDGRQFRSRYKVANILDT